MSNMKGEHIYTSWTVIAVNNDIKSFCIKSTQYKKLAPNALWFTYQNLTSCKHQIARFIDEKLKTEGGGMYLVFPVIVIVLLQCLSYSFGQN